VTLIPEIAIDLNLLYRTALAGIHRAYVFMRLGVQGLSIFDFEGTELPGRHHIEIVPEPMPPELLESYVDQFRAWVVGNGLRELIETYCRFLDEVYGHGLEVLAPADHDERQRAFEEASLREKTRLLWAEMDIEGPFATHIESFSAARTALTHGAGTVRRDDCTDGDELAVTWRAEEVFCYGTNGERYRVLDAPPDLELREPIDRVTVDRERRWTLGQKVQLPPRDLAEICLMANLEAIAVLDALREFGERHGVTMKAAEIVRGGPTE
jgi:hypothetical protein